MERAWMSAASIVVPLMVACAESDGGTADGAAPRAGARAAFEGRLEQGPDSTCPEVGPLFTVGDLGDGRAPVLVAARAIRCRITRTADGAFDVSGAVSVDTDEMSGLFEIGGKLAESGGPVFPTIASAIDASPYYQEDGSCTVRFPSAEDGVALGRMAGEMTCPSARTSAGATCKVIVRFRFEGCASD